MIQVSSSLHFSLQKAGQGEAMNFSNEKSKHFTACLRLCAHWGFWDNRGCCPCFHAWPSLRGSNSTWAPPWSLSTQVMKLHSWIMAPQSCLLQLSPSIAYLCWQPWLQPTAPGPSNPGSKGSSDGWLHWPQHDHILQVAPLGSTWVARGAAVWDYVTLSFPVLESSACGSGTVKPGHSALSYLFSQLLGAWPLLKHATAFPVLFWAEFPHLVSI